MHSKLKTLSACHCSFCMFISYLHRMYNSHVLFVHIIHSDDIVLKWMDRLKCKFCGFFALRSNSVFSCVVSCIAYTCDMFTSSHNNHDASDLCLICRYLDEWRSHQIISIRMESFFSPFNHYSDFVCENVNTCMVRAAPWFRLCVSRGSSIRICCCCCSSHWIRGICFV